MADATAVSSVAVPNSAPESTPSESAAPDFRTMRHKLKVDGQEVEATFDDLVRNFQKGTAADRRFQEAHKLKTEFEPVARMMSEFKQGKLDKLLEFVPEDQARQWMENYLIKYLEHQQLPEGDRRALKLEKDLKQREEELKRLKDSASEGQRQQAEAQAFKEIDEEISEAVKTIGRKPTPRLIARIAEDMLANLDATGSKLSAKDAVSRSLRDVHNDIAEYLPTLPIEELRKLLPKQVLDGLRKADVDDVMSQDPMRGSRQMKSESVTKIRKDEKRGSTEDIFNRLERKLGGNRR